MWSLPLPPAHSTLHAWVGTSAHTGQGGPGQLQVRRWRPLAVSHCPPQRQAEPAAPSLTKLGTPCVTPLQSEGLLLQILGRGLRLASAGGTSESLSKTAQSNRGGGVGAVGARRLRGSRARLPLKGFGSCGNLHLLHIRLKGFVAVLRGTNVAAGGLWRRCRPARFLPL